MKLTHSDVLVNDGGYIEKLIRGEATSEGEWIEYLEQEHAAEPGSSPRFFGNAETVQGENSYEKICSQLSNERHIIDLACGDGFLTDLIIQKHDADCSVVGVDMSEAEIELAQNRDFAPDSNVRFHCGMAHDLPVQDESVDAVVCHMAFMLMRPIEPVAYELDRVLKPGGKFIAVVGSGSAGNGSAGFYQTYQQIMSDFIKEHFPLMKPGSGDQRAREEEGLKDIFRPTRIRLERFQLFGLPLSYRPDEVWDYFKGMYFTRSLNETLQGKLRDQVVGAAHSVAVDGRLHMKLPMALIVAEKNRP